MINRIAKKIYNQYRLSIIAKKVFYAALTDKQKILVDDWAGQRQKGLSFGPMFSNDRTYFNIEKSSLATIETPQEISQIIDKQGYYCPDYREGYVYKKDDKLKSKPIKLLRVLKKSVSDNQQFNMLKKQFDQRLGTSRKQMLNCLICITHNPYDVAGMSTDRSWSSCMNLDGGCHYETALKQVKYGGMCAYLIQNNDKEIERPLARIAIKRLEGNNGGFIFVAQTMIYGDGGFARQLNFVEEVEKILNESNEKTMENERVFIRKDENSWTDSAIYKRYMFKDDKQMMQYFEENMDDCLINLDFMLSLNNNQLYIIFPYLIKNIDVNCDEKLKILSELIYANKLMKQQRILAIDIMIKNKKSGDLYKLIKDDKLTEEQKNLVIYEMIKEQDTQYLYRLIKYDKLTSEQHKQVINLMIKNQDVDNLYSLLYNNKLIEEQSKFALNILINKNELDSLYNLVSEDKLTPEQRELAINAIVNGQDVYYLYWLIARIKLTQEQRTLVINKIIEKHNIQYLCSLMERNILTEKQRKLIIDFFIKNNEVDSLKKLINNYKLTYEQKEQFKTELLNMGIMI